MDNIEVYDNTLLYNDIVNVKYENNILYMNNKLANTNLFNNKHLLFNFGNSNTTNLFIGNSNIGLTSISTDSHILYNLPAQNDNVLRYDNPNDGYITNSLYIQNNTSGTYTNNYLLNPDPINYDSTTITPTINLYDNHKLSIELNTSVNPNTSISVRGNNNITKSENIISSLTYTIDNNIDNNIYKLNHDKINPYVLGSTISGVKNLSDNNTTINLLGSGTSTLETETRNSKTFKYLTLNNYFNFTNGTTTRTVFIVYRTPETISSSLRYDQQVYGHYFRAVPIISLTRNDQNNWQKQGLHMFIAGADQSTGNLTYNPSNTSNIESIPDDDMTIVTSDNNAERFPYNLHLNNVAGMNDVFRFRQYINGSSGNANNWQQSKLNYLHIVAYSVVDGDSRGDNWTNFYMNASPANNTFETILNSNYSGDIMTNTFDVYEVLAYQNSLQSGDIHNVISYLNRKYEVFTTANGTNEHLYSATGTEYSPNASTTLPYTTSLKLHIDMSNNNNIVYQQIPSNGDIENNIFTYNNHGLTQNQPIYFNNNFAGVSANKLYMTDYIDTNTFKIKENINDTETLVFNEPTTNLTHINYENGDIISISDMNMEVVKGTNGIVKKELMSDNTNHKFSATHKPYLYDSLTNKPSIIKLNKAYLKLQPTNTNNVMSKVREIYIVHRMTWPIHRFGDAYKNGTAYNSLEEKDKFHYDFNGWVRYRLGTNLITIEDSNNNILLQLGSLSKFIVGNGKYEAQTYAIQRISNLQMDLYNYFESSSGNYGRPGNTDINNIFTKMMSGSTTHETYKWQYNGGDQYVNPSTIRDQGTLNVGNNGWMGRLGAEDDVTWKNNLLNIFAGNYYEGGVGAPTTFHRGRLESSSDNTKNMLPGTANIIGTDTVINNSLGYNITRIKFREDIDLSDKIIKIGGVYKTPTTHDGIPAAQTNLNPSNDKVFSYHSHPYSQNLLWSTPLTNVTSVTPNDPDTNNDNIHDSDPNRNVPFECWTFDVSENHETHFNPEPNSSDSFEKINDFELGTIMFYGGDNHNNEFTNVHKNLANQFGFKHQTSIGVPADFKWPSSEINSLYDANNPVIYKKYSELIQGNYTLKDHIDISSIGLFKISSINKLFTINTKLQNIINPFKKYVVTEIDNQYYLDNIANKFIDLYKGDTIIFDLSALSDKTKFEIVNNEFDNVAINTNNDTNYIFTYTGSEKTLYYIKSNYKSKDLLNFGDGNTGAIDANTKYHCFTGFIYNIPDGV